ncbi:MAG: helix-turn-helix domain-containing protein [Clostridiales bacterium]|nr:helix-turn-helix domain-containing protein [Clostridiales bacterium]
MNEHDFSVRLMKLREQKGVSAREMSLFLGQNPGYINNIENEKAMPSMKVFFSICDYFDISPHEFFDVETEAPYQTQEIVSNLNRLNQEQRGIISAVIKEMIR